MTLKCFRQLTIAVCLMTVGGAFAQSQVTVAGFGGLVLDAEVDALFADARSMGVVIRKDRHGNWPGVKAHLASGATGWDIISIGAARCEMAARTDALMPIDYTVVDKSLLPNEAAQPKYVKVYAFAYGIVYQKAKYGANPPKNWADFWDTKRFPGRRSLDGEGLYALEAALLADGVRPADVYKVLRAPRGVDRALAKLREIKPAVAVWFGSVGQNMQLMHDGEADMTIMSNARALALTEANVNVGFVMNEAVMDYECFMVPKTAKNPKAAMQLINSALAGKNQAAFAMTVKYAPVNPKTYDLGLITPETMKWLPTSPQNIGTQLLLDPIWYASPQTEAVYKQFQKMKQE